MRNGVKRMAACTLCGKEVFECMARWEEEDNIKNPERAYLSGQMKRIGKPFEGATRITFLLASGEVMDLTFCAECADALDAVDYNELWAIVIRSWLQELIDERPNWFLAQMQNMILAEVGRRSWQEVMRG